MLLFNVCFFAGIRNRATKAYSKQTWTGKKLVRNSPLTYVERIETPLMIVRRDQNFVAMQQGEQVFTALYRQHRRAKFVRLLGEGHVIESLFQKPFETDSSDDTEQTTFRSHRRAMGGGEVQKRS